MHLACIEISHFRNLRDCVLELQPGLNVVLGRNNAGKTNVFSALRHALGYAAARGDLEPLTRDDFTVLPSGQVEPIRVELLFDGLSRRDLITFFDILEPELQDLERSNARIHFEATWDPDRERVVPRRSGGPTTGTRVQPPAEVLQALPITYLPALRDALAALTPGYRSRLVDYLEAISTEKDREEVLRAFNKANEDLETDGGLVDRAQDKINKGAQRIAGTDFTQTSIKATDPEFRRVLRNLRLALPSGPVEDLSGAGLGYQNILYVSTVLLLLGSVREGDSPLLLVEEPEAHLHPQLAILLARQMSETQPGPGGVPQTILTTHSPTIAANVLPSQIVVMTVAPDGFASANALSRADLTRSEERSLQRMMDVTRSQLYFARGALLVEGVSEALLFPVLAHLLDLDLEFEHISVVPICGVAFRVFQKILGSQTLPIPVAVVSDADPPVRYDDGDAKTDPRPSRTAGRFEISSRAKALREVFSEKDWVRVFLSDVTLEYDLAAAGPHNAAWGYPSNRTDRAWSSSTGGWPRGGPGWVDARGHPAEQVAPPGASL